MFRGKRFGKTSDKANVAMEGLSSSFRKYWSSFLLAENVNTTFTSSEDAMYAEYRDELDDFVTIED